MGGGNDLAFCITIKIKLKGILLGLLWSSVCVCVQCLPALNALKQWSALLKPWPAQEQNVCGA